MTQVFISYSRKDLPFVERLAKDLKAAGLEVWYDLSGLEIGAHWGMEIQAAIQKSRFIIIVLSPNSIVSEWVEREFIYASNHKLKVIPLIHKPCDLPLWSVTMHYIDMQGRNYKRHFGELLQVLGVEPGLEKRVTDQVGSASLKAAEENVRRDQPATQKSAAEERLRQDDEIKARHAAREQEQTRLETQKREQQTAEVARLQLEIETALAGGRWGKARQLIPQLKRQGPQGHTLADGLRKRLPRIRIPVWVWAPPAALVIITLLGFWLRGNLGFALLAPDPTATANLTHAPFPVASLPPTETLSPAATFTPTRTPLPTVTPTVTFTPVPGPTLVRSLDKMVTIFVPAGKFLMGTTDSDPLSESDQRPQHTVFLDAYWIDQTDVTNGMYARCVNARACQAPSSVKSFSSGSYYGNPTYKDYPVVYVNWTDANAYCTWAGGRLPSEAEWEKAARGTDGRSFPWGNTSLNKNLLNYGFNIGDTTIVGKYPAGASPYGALDMAGNVWQWVNDWYDMNYYANSPSSNPHGPTSGTERVLRGGTFNDGEHDVSSTYRASFSPSNAVYTFGFRCARSSH